MSKARKEEFARFFEYVYQRALALDPRELADDVPLVKALASMRGSARIGYYEVTGEWLSPTGAATKAG